MGRSRTRRRRCGPFAGSCRRTGSSCTFATRRGRAATGCTASDAVGTPLRRGGAGADPAQGRRPGEDGPARRDDAGADATGWTADRGVGAGRGARSDAGPGAVALAGDARPAQGAPAVAEFPAAPWAQLTLRPLDQDASPLARRTRLCPPGAALALEEM